MAQDLFEWYLDDIPALTGTPDEAVEQAKRRFYSKLQRRTPVRDFICSDQFDLATFLELVCYVAFSVDFWLQSGNTARYLEYRQHFQANLYSVIGGMFGLNREQISDLDAQLADRSAFYGSSGTESYLLLAQQLRGLLEGISVQYALTAQTYVSTAFSETFQRLLISESNRSDEYRVCCGICSEVLAGKMIPVPFVINCQYCGAIFHIEKIYDIETAPISYT